VADDDGWARLAVVGSKISNRYPSFDSRNYGYAKLSSLVRAIDLFTVAKRQEGADRKYTVIYIRKK
jgi:hypothetical protein